MSTADDIMDLAQDYIQTGGYNAFSYKDIAQELGIKTSSIHYHFSKKADLGCAVVKRYIALSEKMMEDTNRAELDLSQDSFQVSWQEFDDYLAPFFDLNNTGTKICLCAALGGEIMSLPKQLRTEVSAFFAFHKKWLAQLLRDGQTSGAFHFKDAPENRARHIFSTLEGALIIGRTNKDSEYLDSVVQLLKEGLRR